MQFLLELENGNRRRVSEDQWKIDRYKPNYKPIVFEGSIRVYSLNGRANKPPRALSYGGRGNPKNPSGYRGN